MKFEDIPLRTNTELIDEAWFNTLRQAGIDQASQPTIVSTKTTDFNAESGYYLVNTTGGAVAVQLPAASTNAVITVKKISSDTNAVVINRVGSELLEGLAASYQFTIKNQAITLITDGTDWFIV